MLVHQLTTQSGQWKNPALPVCVSADEFFSRETLTEYSAHREPRRGGAIMYRRHVSTPCLPSEERRSTQPAASRHLPVLIEAFRLGDTHQPLQCYSLEEIQVGLRYFIVIMMILSNLRILHFSKIG